VKYAGAATIAVFIALAACSTTHRVQVVRAPQACHDQTVQIYFEPESAEVTAEGRAVIGAAATSAKGCVVRTVQVVGLADAVGSPTANLQLSKERARSVSAVLAEAGLPPAEFQLAAAGSQGAVTTEGTAKPLRRRADVILRLTPR
jgi:outer membrane protein OmpA-like peptidoglycan-associated protein